MPREAERINNYVAKITLSLVAILFLTATVLVPIFCILNSIIYKEISLNLRTLMITDNKLNIIGIPYYKRDSKKLAEYFKEYLNVDISKLKNI